MSLEIAWKQNILVKDSYLLKLLLVALGFGSRIVDSAEKNICSVLHIFLISTKNKDKMKNTKTMNRLDAGPQGLAGAA